MASREKTAHGTWQCGPLASYRELELGQLAAAVFGLPEAG